MWCSSGEPSGPLIRHRQERENYSALYKRRDLMLIGRGRDGSVVSLADEAVVLQSTNRLVTTHAQPFGHLTPREKLTCPVGQALPDEGKAGHCDQDVPGLQRLGDPERG